MDDKCETSCLDKITKTLVPKQNENKASKTRECHVYFGPTMEPSIPTKMSRTFVPTTKSKIKREYTVAETPEQNGVTERYNRTIIVETARSLSIESKLPKCY